MTVHSSHPNVEVLRQIYADLTRIGEFCADDVVLHSAERGLPGAQALYVGRAAVEAKEQELIHASDGTLVMSVQGIQANDHFGAVLGELQVDRSGVSMRMPFCGLWKFRDGRIVEHWENAYDVEAFGRFLAETADT